MDEEHFGEFYDGRSYIVLYSYTQREVVKSVAYFWAGSRASPSDFIAYQSGLAEQLAEKMESEGGKPPRQVRYRQYGEGDYFLSLFEGVMIIHKGYDPNAESAFTAALTSTDTPVESLSTDANTSASTATSTTALYGVSGHSVLDVRAVQLEKVTARVLNSMRAFALFTVDTAYVWFGRGAIEEVRRCAEYTAQHLQRERKLVAVEEGQETEEFWADIGGKEDYANEIGIPAGYPRLYQCSEATGTLYLPLSTVLFFQLQAPPLLYLFGFWNQICMLRASNLITGGRCSSSNFNNTEI